MFVAEGGEELRLVRRAGSRPLEHAAVAVDERDVVAPGQTEAAAHERPWERLAPDAGEEDTATIETRKRVGAADRLAVDHDLGDGCAPGQPQQPAAEVGVGVAAGLLELDRASPKEPAGALAVQAPAQGVELHVCCPTCHLVGLTRVGGAGFTLVVTWVRTDPRSGETASVLASHSLNPEALAAHLGLYRTLMYGVSPLSRVEREALAVAVSAANDCHY